MDAFIGTILPWSMNWAPNDWMLCQGQELPVNNYQALYSLIGNTYGGTAPNTFCLPDLRGRIPLGAGQGPGLTSRVYGGKGGSETVTLKTSQLPQHNHVVQVDTEFNAEINGGNIENGECEVTVELPENATNSPATSPNPSGNSCLASPRMGTTPVNLYSTSSPNTTLMTNSVQATGSVTGTVTGKITGKFAKDFPTGNTGAGEAIPNMQPYLTLNYIICCHGIYPPKP